MTPVRDTAHAIPQPRRGAGHTLRRLTLAASAALAVLGGGAVQAQDDAWPSKPITIIGGFPGGAATDLYARKLGQELGKEFKVSFVADSRTGAGGNIASAAVAQAKPDGYTLLLGTAGTHAINATLYKKLGFDVMKDFTHIALLGYLPNVLLINPEKHPDIKNCKDLLAAAARKPGDLSYASTGNGASGHLAGAQFSAASHTTYLHVPYRGQGPAMTALLAKEVDFFFNQSAPSVPIIRSGKGRALGVTSLQRVAALPEVPTVAEACGLPGFESTTWYGLFAPAGLPPAIQAKLSNAVVATIGTPEFRQWLAEQGITPPADASPAAFRRIHEADLVRWAKIVKDSGATVD